MSEFEKNIQIPNREQIFDHLVNRIVLSNYKRFKSGEENPKHLLSIRYDVGNNNKFLFSLGASTISVDYLGLDTKILEALKSDLDLSMRFEFKEFAYLAPFSDMPAILGSYLGDRFWKVKSLIKLNTDSKNERSMLIRNRLYHPVAKDSQNPHFEFWMAEENKSDSASDESLNPQGERVTIPQIIG